MRKLPKVEAYVVYRMTLQGKPNGVAAVCLQSEWDALEKERPGYHKLIRSGIVSEAEAEQIARDSQIDAEPATKSKRK